VLFQEGRLESLESGDRVVELSRRGGGLSCYQPIAKRVVFGCRDEHGNRLAVIFQKRRLRIG